MTPSLFPDPIAPPAKAVATAGTLPKLSDRNGRMIELLAQYPEGLTDQDFAWATSSSDRAIRHRLGELQARGLIADSGRTEANWRGEMVPVWILNNREA